MTVSAGHFGDGVRSDCRITLSHGPARFDLLGQGRSLYPDAIRRESRQILESLGLANVNLRIEDAGALPFTLQARTEAAGRALSGHTDHQHRVIGNATSRKDRLRRTRLYIPGNTPKYFPNAGLYNADMLIFDLEDAVPPTQKDEARILVRHGLNAIDPGNSEIAVRINPLPLGQQDIEELIGSPVQLFLLPKAENPEQILEVDRLLSGTPMLLLPIIESARGAIAAYEIAMASDRVIGLAIGLEDYTSDLGVERTAHGREAWWLYGQIVNAARAAGIPAFASVYSGIEDEEGLTQYVTQVRSLGFEGVGCIHPRQVGVVHRAFLPSDEEIGRAKAVIEAFEQQGGAINVGGSMVDRPVYLRALRTVERAGIRP